MTPVGVGGVVEKRILSCVDEVCQSSGKTLLTTKGFKVPALEYDQFNNTYGPLISASHANDSRVRKVFKTHSDRTRMNNVCVMTYLEGMNPSEIAFRLCDSSKKRTTAEDVSRILVQIDKLKEEIKAPKVMHHLY